MDFYAINALRENHAGWSLLRAQNAPLAVSFFIKAFTGPNQRDIGRQELIDHLDDVLFGLREVFGEDKYPARPVSTWMSGRPRNGHGCGNTTSRARTSRATTSPPPPRTWSAGWRA
ncbi:uncharacterized protein MSMEG_1279/MSMEI_1241 [Arthrobacter sp. Hiyo4]|nr:uncharacterized protein MSMEG_1279/MSMEI_1241 [Arthrobacter sp. Hiyo4]